MIIQNKIKKSQAKHILKLIEESARAEVLARLGRFDNLEFADWYKIHLEKHEELLKYVFGTSSLVELGERWRIIKKKKRKKKKV